MKESWILDVKFEDVKNWDAIDDIIQYNQRQINLFPYNLEEKERLLAEIEHLKNLLKTKKEREI